MTNTRLSEQARIVICVGNLVQGESPSIAVQCCHPRATARRGRKVPPPRPARRSALARSPAAGPEIESSGGDGGGYGRGASPPGGGGDGGGGRAGGQRRRRPVRRRRLPKSQRPACRVHHACARREGESAVRVRATECALWIRRRLPGARAAPSSAHVARHATVLSDVSKSQTVSKWVLVIV
ncbi:hypothetical protein R5R35_001646 [Gryllus longicercus]|uniref:Uncharacterized protein n=1 Tax=Gryllus longicercus TaxID=2509291 RepID=A0AAN9VZA3_9ORTH